MFHSTTPHFETGKFTSHFIFLPDEEYSRALDCLVKCCTDILLTDQTGRIFLGKRKVHPQPDWWFVGGRMRPGETPASSAVRNVRRELGITLSTDRLKSVGHYSFLWEMRNQPPMDHGTADISIVHTAVLTPEEAAIVKLDTAEYSSSQWILPEDLLAGDYHPALKQATRDLLSLQCWEHLHAAIKSNVDDGQISQLAKNLVKAKGD